LIIQRGIKPVLPVPAKGSGQERANPDSTLFYNGNNGISAPRQAKHAVKGLGKTRRRGLTRSAMPVRPAQGARRVVLRRRTARLYFRLGGETRE
jgi:hypothetical protein